jgi:hypothetical protein
VFYLHVYWSRMPASAYISLYSPLSPPQTTFLLLCLLYASKAVMSRITV